jgi:hypothetical protein
MSDAEEAPADAYADEAGGESDEAALRALLLPGAPPPACPHLLELRA